MSWSSMMARMASWGRHWWRAVLVVAAVALSTFPWQEWGFSWFGAVPMLVWCGGLARSLRAGLVVGAALLIVLAWFVVPRELGESGRLVPSSLELFWLYPICAAVICGVGVFAQRRRPAGAGWLLAMVAGGVLVTGYVAFSRWQVPPGDEGVVPLPPGLHVARGDVVCGSGNCGRELDAVGDDALVVLRGHLATRGFTSRGNSPDIGERMCRVTGLVVSHTVCAELRELPGGPVRVTWYIQSR